MPTPISYFVDRRYLPAVIVTLFIFVGVATAQGQLVANSLEELRSYASQSNVTVTLAAGEYWISGDGNNPTFLDFSGSNSTFDLSAAQIKMDTRDLAGYGNSQSITPITVTGSNNFIQGLDFSGYDIDLDTDPDARRYADRSGVYLQVTGDDNHLQDTTLLVRGSSPYGLGDVFGKGARFPESGQPVEDGGFAFISHNKMSSFLVTGGATNTVVDNLDLTSQAYGHGFFTQGGATNTTIRNSTLTGELIQGNDAIAHPEYQEYAAGADGILGTADDGGTRSGTPLPENIQLSAQEDGIRAYTGTSGLTVENTVVTNFRSGVHSTFTDGVVMINNVEVYGTENAFVPGSNTTITNSKADIVNGPAIYVQYNDKSNTTIDIEIVGDQPIGEEWAVAYLNGNNFDVTIRSDLPAGFLPEDSLVRFGQTWFNNWRDQLRPTTPEEGDPGAFTNSTFTNLTNEFTVLGNLATGNTGVSQAGVVTNGKDNDYDGISVVLSGTHVVLTDTAGLGNNGNDENGDFDADIFETNASIVFDGATLELEPGIRISNEKLTITGDGVDGQGALYTDGTVDTDTRFGSSNRNDNSAIFLDGDASIGVGIEGRQLNIGGLKGEGDFTKRGAGLLTIGKASTFDGDMIIEEGQVSARANVVHTNLTVAAGAGISANGDFAYNTEGVAHIDGELGLNARAVAEDLTHRIGSLTGSGSVVMSNANAGTQSTLQIVGADGSANFTGSIAGQINIEKSGSGTQILSGSLTHAGTTTVDGGVLLIDGNHNGGGLYTINNGTLGGNGFISVDVKLFQNGRLDPGQVGQGFGTLSLGDDIDFNPGTTVVFDLQNSEEHDRLIVADDTRIYGGTLALNIHDASQFSVGDTLTLIESNGGFFAGEFDDVVVSGGLGVQVIYEANELKIIFESISLLGDYNGNGSVDAADYTVWQDSFGSTTNLAADGNANGVIDAADFTIWQDQFGQTAANSQTVSASIPEPSSLFAISAAGAFLIHRNRS